MHVCARTLSPYTHMSVTIYHIHTCVMCDEHENIKQKRRGKGLRCVDVSFCVIDVHSPFNGESRFAYYLFRTSNSTLTHLPPTSCLHTPPPPLTDVCVAVAPSLAFNYFQFHAQTSRINPHTFSALRLCVCSI